MKGEELYLALFDKPPFFCSEFWLKNIPAKEIGISTLPDNFFLETKYKVKELGIKPFPVTKLQFEIIDKLAEIAWKNGTEYIHKNYLF